MTTAASGRRVKLPSGESCAVPPPALTASRKPSHNEVAPGKWLLSTPVPCHVSVHPPDWRAMSSAPSPATSKLPPRRNGSTPSFLSSTSDLRTASRARARCEGDPSRSHCPESGREEG